jgi:tetratricopeptide (TPR) repeat protein
MRWRDSQSEDQQQSQPAETAPIHDGPDEGRAYSEQCDRGLRELAAGRAEEAVRALARAVFLRPDLAMSHFHLARAFQQAGKIEAARRAYQRTVEIDTASAAARSALAALPPPPARRPEFRPGQLLCSTTTGLRYRVQELRADIWGPIYIAKLEADGQIYALKTFQPWFPLSEEDRDRLEREALTWVTLARHPNLVAAHRLECVEGVSCLVLEHEPGPELANLLLKQRRLSPLNALHLAFPCCDGLLYAHLRLGLVHGDIQPCHCLLSEQGTLKVTGFGMTRAWTEALDIQLGLTALPRAVALQYTTPPGTRHYLAPEHFQERVRLDPRTDIYAFGVMLYQMLTGDLPPDGRVAQAHVRANAERHRLREDLLTLILQCVDPRPASRPPSFWAVRKELGVVFRRLTRKLAPASSAPLPMDFPQWISRGVALRALGRTKEAIRCYEFAREIDPHNSDPWWGESGVLYDLGQYEEAITCCDRGLQLSPAHGELWKSKAMALGALGGYEQELACYERSLESNPLDSDLWLYKGLALTGLGRYEKALPCYDRGLQLNPGDLRLWKYKGAALYRLGRLQEALTCFSCGLEINPADSDLWHNRGVVLIELGRPGEAEESFRQSREVAGAEMGMS